MMNFKLEILFAGVLATTPWGWGSSANTYHVAPPPKHHIIKLQKPLKQPTYKKIKPLRYLPFHYAPPGTHANSYAPGNCTWLVASMKNVPSSWGNANTWAYFAAQQGYKVSNRPIIGSIAQTSRGSLGHVALVLNVRGNQVYIIEMNVLGYGAVDYRWEAASDFVYIYY